MRVAGFCFSGVGEKQEFAHAEARRRGEEKGEPKRSWVVLSHCPSRASSLRVRNLFNLIGQRQTGPIDLVEVARCCRCCVRRRKMLQDLRDADQAVRRLKGCRSIGGLQDGCRLLGMVRPVDARHCRGLQDRGTPNRRSSGCGPRQDHRGPRAGLASLSNKSSQRSLGDSLAIGAARKATFGDTRRQLLGLQVGTGSCVVPERQWPSLRCDLPEIKQTK